jgi:hypothetical protein
MRFGEIAAQEPPKKLISQKRENLASKRNLLNRSYQLSPKSNVVGGFSKRELLKIGKMPTSCD